MSIYTLSEASLETNLYLGERNIYGSSRLGTGVIIQYNNANGIPIVSYNIKKGTWRK